MKIKRVFLFSSYNIKDISTRYRGVYILNGLSKQYYIQSSFVYPGYTFSVIVNFFVSYFRVLFSFSNNIIVIYQKLHTKGVYTSLLKILVWLKPKGTLYDTDDADYLRYYDQNIYYFMRQCKMCTVGSSYLKEFTKQYNPNVLLLTSPIIKHTEIKEHRNSLLHIGWVGDYGLNQQFTSPFSHKVSLNQILFPILKELQFQFKLTILGVKNPADKQEIEQLFKPYPNILLDIPEGVNWLDEHTIYHKIKEFDIGVSPMVNHEFNIAKSAFKAKQYLSCGVPVLASPVGENLRLVRDGVNGFICENELAFKQRMIEINEMTSEQYDKLRSNTLLDLTDFSVDKYCEDLINGIKQYQLLK